MSAFRLTVQVLPGSITLLDHIHLPSSCREAPQMHPPEAHQVSPGTDHSTPLATHRRLELCVSSRITTPNQHDKPCVAPHGFTLASSGTAVSLPISAIGRDRTGRDASTSCSLMLYFWKGLHLLLPASSHKQFLFCTTGRV